MHPALSGQNSRYFTTCAWKLALQVFLFVLLCSRNIGLAQKLDKAAARPAFLFPSQYSSTPTITTSPVNPTIFTTASVSNETPADFQKEVLGISSSLLHDPRVVAMLERRFFNDKFNSILGFVSLHYEFPSTLRERGVGVNSHFMRRRRKAEVCLALVLAKLHSGQAVVSGFGFFPGKQGGDRESPSTARAGPASVRILYPNQRTSHAATLILLRLT
jgi:hypothetical protein